MIDALVSIIVPIYNVEKYLDRCLLSIKNQTYSNLEVIMVNDGSKDSSRNIAAHYQDIDHRFKLFDKENGGLSSGRNYGMRFVTGEFVAFIDSDDFLETDYVEVLLNSFDSNTDIVIGDYVIFNAKNGHSYIHGPQYKPGIYSTTEEKKELIYALLTGKPVMSVWKNLYRVSFLRDNDISFVSERLVYAEDKLFHVEAYTLAKCIRIVPDIVFYHLIVPGSLSQGYRKNHFEMSKELHHRIEALLLKYYDEDFVNIYNSTIPNSIGASMLHMCKCGLKESNENIKKILNDSYVRDAYKRKYARTSFFRYWLLFKIGSMNSSIMVALFARCMLLCSPIYHWVQRKKEYIK